MIPAKSKRRSLAYIDGHGNASHATAKNFPALKQRRVKFSHALTIIKVSFEDFFFQKKGMFFMKRKQIFHFFAAYKVHLSRVSFLGYEDPAKKLSVFASYRR